MKYYPLIEPFFDAWNLIDKKFDVDGGDSLNREGLFAVTSYFLYKDGKMSESEYLLIKNRYQGSIKLLSAKLWGNYTRHANPAWWASRPDRMSRDQFTPNLLAMILMGMNKELIKCFLGHCLRLLLFTTNIRGNGGFDKPLKMPDITVMEFWAHYLRSLPACIRWIFWPVLCVLDLENLGGSINKTYFYGKDPTNSDDVNHIVSLLFASDRVSTPTIWLSRWIYRRRPLCDLQGLEQTDFGPYSAMVHYFRNEMPLHLLFKDIMDRLKK